jgi:hypothetical protein
MQVNSNEFLQAQRLSHEWARIDDQRAHAKAERERTESERYRFLAFQEGIRAANPGQQIDRDTVEYLWRDHEARQKAAAQARFTALLTDLRGTLQTTWQACPARSRRWPRSVP